MSAMSPADDSILICSLPQPETQPETQPQPELPPTEKNGDVKKSEPVEPVVEPIQPVRKKSGGSRRRSRGVQLRSSDSDEEKGRQPEAASKGVAAGVRVLPGTLKDPKKADKANDSRRTTGFCGENPPPVLQEAEEAKESSGKAGSCAGNSPVVPQNAVNVAGEMGGTAKAGSCGEKSNIKNAKGCISGGNAGSDGGSLLGALGSFGRDGKRPMNLLDALSLLPPTYDASLENVDILEIAAMKGILFEPPRWHRPGGYDRKPKEPK